MRLNLGSRTLGLDEPKVMGIINVTPDSFSDGGRYSNSDKALRSALHMVAAGAAIIDIGGESTRPGAGQVSDQEQMDRVLPVIESLRAESDVILSVDTGSPAVMTAATSLGANLINDIFALTLPGALEAAAASNVAVCVMHMQGVPATMQDNPHYESLPGDVIDFLRDRVSACTDAGIASDMILIDPGFGFGKSDEQNITLLATLNQLVDLGPPVVVGLSRKGTLGSLTGRAVGERLPAGIASAVMAAERGAHIVRTHDVAETVDALKIVTAVGQMERW